MSLEVIVLAAGQGKRMHSTLPKVLHVLGDQPLLGHVLSAVRVLAPTVVHVVLGYGTDQIRAAFTGESVCWAYQAEQLGTGHAVAQAISAVKEDSTVLVLYGDVPLIASATLHDLISQAGAHRLGLLTADLADPQGYGRILRDAAGKVIRIVEQKDATPEQAAVREINTGILAAPASRLRGWLGRLENRNAQREYYLTDVVGMAVADGVEIVTRQPRAVWEILGVNSKRELAEVERIHQKNAVQVLLDQGVTLRDPARVDVRGELVCGRDVTIDVNVVFEGNVTLGDGVTVGPNSVIRDTVIGAATRIYPNCVIEEAEIGQDCRIGPFARIRPGTRLDNRAHVGNFVEIKNSVIGEGSKANHLTYVGDSSVGKNVN
ncbi:MAG TPA: bifunctional UDP-N-acetylglucosamine diphosphorylase/glucosamine-1-phosphate N-acetyltransferase GlmU, partial [Burkholderiales bacterium]|nr:bifunctional UDP-N-acetylglucosamine diphosphorylase/glucosamine-1-phosphate N-acetyltransferase GlmU [Burkholderiales bacterium]